MRAARLVLSGLFGYLLGSAPSADVASRVSTRGRVDLRDEGSGNPGATNAAQVLGTHWGALVLAADFAKGAVAGSVGKQVAGDAGAYLAATASIAGHNWPVWSGFRGGKGVATSAGACLTVFPAYFPIDAVVVGVSAVSTQRAEVSMWVTAPIWIVGSWTWWRLQLPNAWGPKPSRGLFLFALSGSAMVLTKFAAARKAA